MVISYFNFLKEYKYNHFLIFQKKVSIIYIFIFSHIYWIIFYWILISSFTSQLYRINIEILSNIFSYKIKLIVYHLKNISTDIVLFIYRSISVTHQLYIDIWVWDQQPSIVLYRTNKICLLLFSINIKKRCPTLIINKEYK